MRHLIAILALAILSFLLGSLGYLALSSMLGGAFAGLFRMFMYHEQHPFQYIAIVSSVFGGLGTLWANCFRGSQGRTRVISIIATIFVTLIIASVPGGILWKIHDMQAGYFPRGFQFWDDLCWGAMEGLMVGWLVILVSVPYNILGLIIGVIVLDRFELVLDSLGPPKDEQFVTANRSLASTLNSTASDQGSEDF